MPPVETISTPSSAQPARELHQPALVRHAQERAPDAHLARARTVSTAGCRRLSHPASTRTSRGFAGSSDTRPAAISRTARGSSRCSTSWNALADRRDVAMVGEVERFLKQDRAAVHALVDEVDGHARHLHAVLDRLLDRAEPGERGKQRRMHVHDPPGEAADEARREQLHEPGEHDELHLALLEPAGERLVALGSVGLVGQREHRRLDPRPLGPLEPASVRAARHDADDLDPVPAVHVVDERLEVRPLARDQDCPNGAQLTPRRAAPGRGRRSSRAGPPR